MRGDSTRSTHNYGRTALGSISLEYHWIAGAGIKIRGTRQGEHDQISFGEELTGATALVAIPIMNPCIVQNIIFLCDIMIPNSSR